MTHPLDLVLRRVRRAVRLVLTACPLLATARAGLWRPALLYTVGGLILAIRPLAVLVGRGGGPDPAR